jgi:hypothetical protein
MLLGVCFTFMEHSNVTHLKHCMPCCPQWEKTAASIMEELTKFQGHPKYMALFESYVDAGKKKDTTAMADMLNKIVSNVNVLHDADTCPEICASCVTSELELCRVTDSSTWRYHSYDSSIVAFLSLSHLVSALAIAFLSVSHDLTLDKVHEG